MTKDEAIEILEGIAKDPAANPTSRVRDPGAAQPGRGAETEVEQLRRARRGAAAAPPQKRVVTVWDAVRVAAVAIGISMAVVVLLR
jgi:hypothetical protein